MKLPKIYRDSVRPWMVRASFPYSPETVAKIKEIPGSIWLPGPSEWLIPVDYLQEIEALVGVRAAIFVPALTSDPLPSLWPWQKEAFTFAVNQPGGAIIAHEMKLGKSLTALEIARCLGFQKILIVSPAMSRPQWVKEIFKHPTLAVRPLWSFTKDPKRLPKYKKVEYDTFLLQQVRISLVSYGLLSKLPTEHDYDCIIVDEIHELGNEKSKQSRLVRELRTKYPNAYVIGLTGTLQRNKTASLYNPIDTLFPGRLGIFWSEKNPQKSFAGRYCNVEWNGYGHDFMNIEFPTPEQSANLERFKQQLAGFAHRKTKAEIAHLLPAVIPNSLRIEEDFDLVELVKSELEAGKVCLFYTRNESWNKAYTELRANLPAEIAIEVLSGEDVAEKRYEKLDKLNAATKAVAICSIDAVKMTINLSAFTNVHFMEISEKLTTMSQAIGRFQVPEKKNPIYMTFWYTSESYSTAERLARAADAIGTVMSAGSSEDQMRAAFAKQTRYTEAEWTEAISDILSVTF